jgi:hypothetical protein
VFLGQQRQQPDAGDAVRAAVVEEEEEEEEHPVSASPTLHFGMQADAGEMATPPASVDGEDAERHKAWRWRFSRKWQASRHHGLATQRQRRGALLGRRGAHGRRVCTECLHPLENILGGHRAAGRICAHHLPVACRWSK